MTDRPVARPLSERRVEAIVERLGLDARPAVDPVGLHAVYSAWCRAVPFDNLQKLVALDTGAAELPGMDADAFFTAWERDGTGGTCWSSNNALHSLLRALGFDAQLWSAAMFDGPANHGTTIVTLDDERWLVDTAVHGDVPARIVDGETSTVDHHGYPTTIRHDAKGTVFDHPTPDPDFVIPCRILAPTDHAATVEANERTRDWSPFNAGIMAAVNDEAGVWMLKDLSLGRIDLSGVSTRTLDAREADEFLVDVVGCSAPLIARVRATVG